MDYFKGLIYPQTYLYDLKSTLMVDKDINNIKKDSFQTAVSFALPSD